MTPAQQSALESLVGRALTQAEVGQIDACITPLGRNDDAIAAILSVGRMRPVHTETGVGTILAVLRNVGDGGGKFLDTLESVGQVDRDVYWTMYLIKSGKLRIDMAPVRAGMAALAAAMPALADKINALLTLGIEPDPISSGQVVAALNGVA